MHKKRPVINLFLSQNILGNPLIQVGCHCRKIPSFNEANKQFEVNFDDEYTFFVRKHFVIRSVKIYRLKNFLFFFLEKIKIYL